MSLTDTYTLSNGTKIPVVGLGTWQTPDGDVAYQSVLTALKAGYRLIDTAAGYQNEEVLAAPSVIPSNEKTCLSPRLWN